MRSSDIFLLRSRVFLFERVRLVEEDNGNHLVIGPVTPEDAGVFTCQISSYQPRELSHNVSVLGRKLSDVKSEENSSVAPEILLTTSGELEVSSADNGLQDTEQNVVYASLGLEAVLMILVLTTGL